MTRYSRAVSSGLLAICLAVLLRPAACQADETDQIAISYVEPESEELRPAYLEIRNREVLEQLRTFLSPLRLPRRLSLQAKQCGSDSKDYQPGGPVIICYEEVRRIAEVLPVENEILLGPGATTGENRGRLRKDDLIVAPIVMITLQKAALAIFDILDVPVWGNAEEAANRLAGYLMTQFGDQVAWKALMGSAWYLAQTTSSGVGTDFYYVRDPEAHQFYGILCMAYASDPKSFGFLVRNLDIPGTRVEKCTEDFVRVQQAFDATILPHVDQLLLQKVRAMPWLPDIKRK
ncbi:DUF4344 domain-containing metallopeptidase [Methyloceanibacter sp.]|uniref:DUF4344 domain-containing metallopeptidase n=1 Tax=Methyloceanibacter sp. TaxID=1965321 RepID=UPI002D32CF4A|nr:DUF4344 domain-containing metallopeptidase [Methyloceanibacter sp.]HZP09108.1 DUF4344 domain-containing metallopeptidase [Methyloceanibacter sp.]